MNNELVTLNENNVPTTTSLKVADHFNKGHNDVLKKIRLLIEGGVGGFSQTPYVHPQNGQTYNMYEMDRKAFMILIMGFEGKEALEFKKNFVDAFDAMEEELVKQQEREQAKQIPYEQVKLLAQTVIDQDKLLEEQKPKVEFYDALSTEEKTYTLTDGFKRAGMRGKNSMDWCREIGLLFKNHRNLNEPTTKALDMGIMTYEKRTYKANDGYLKTEWQAHMTGKGIQYFTKLNQKGKVPAYTILTQAVNGREPAFA